MISNCRGVTALEAIISTLIFSVVVMMAFLLTFAATRSFNEKVRTSDLQTKGERCIKTMEDCISEAQTLSTGDSRAQMLANGTVSQNSSPNSFCQGAITFQVPVTYNTPDNNSGYTEYNTTYGSAVWYEFNGVPAWTYNGFPPGASLPNGGANSNPLPKSDFTPFLKWGWRDDNRLVTNLTNNEVVPLQGPGMAVNSSDLPPGMSLNGGVTLGGFIQFQFVQDLTSNLAVASPPGTFDEALEGVDVDGDGLLQSRYAVGYIEQSFWMLPAGTNYVASNQSAYNFSGATKVSESVYVLASSNILQPLPTSSTGNTPNYNDYTGKVQASNPPGTTKPYDMQTNLIFVVNGSKMNISYYLLSISEDHKIPHLAHCQTSIFLRNNADGN